MYHPLTVKVKWIFLPWVVVREASQEEQRPFLGFWSLVLYFTTATRIWIRLGCAWRISQIIYCKQTLYIQTINHVYLCINLFAQTDSPAGKFPHLNLIRFHWSHSDTYSSDTTSVRLQIRALLEYINDPSCSLLFFRHMLSKSAQISFWSILYSVKTFLFQVWLRIRAFSLYI